MPTSNFGTGTLYYGKRDFWPDGSYVTTEFVALLWIALVPLRSLRVKRVKTEFEVIAFTSRYTEFARSSPRLKQVISVYAFECAMFALVIGYSHAADLLPSVQLPIVLGGAAFVIASLSLIPFLLRKTARRNAGRRVG